MIICTKCRKEMLCLLTGVKCLYGEGHIYSGDQYVCTKCGAGAIKTAPDPYHDPDLKPDGVRVIQMESK